MSTIDKLMQQTFGRARDPRSDEYKAGCRALLECKAFKKQIKCPYPMGTAQADAFYAGTDEGHGVWRNFCVKVSQDQPTGDT